MISAAAFASELPCSLAQTQLDSLYSHYQLLCRWNVKVNLVSAKSLKTDPIRHYAEGLFLAAHLPSIPLRIIDLG